MFLFANILFFILSTTCAVHALAPSHKDLQDMILEAEAKKIRETYLDRTVVKETVDMAKLVTPDANAKVMGSLREGQHQGILPKKRALFTWAQTLIGGHFTGNMGVSTYSLQSNIDSFPEKLSLRGKVVNKDEWIEWTKIKVEPKTGVAIAGAKHMGGGVLSSGWVQEEREVFQHYPVVAWIATQGARPVSTTNVGPVVCLSDVPDMVDVSDIPYGGSQLSKWDEAKVAADLKTGSGQKKSLYFMATDRITGAGQKFVYDDAEIKAMWRQFFLMFAAAKENGEEHFLTMPIGAGAFYHSRLMSYTLQAVAALYAGWNLDDVIFYDMRDEERVYVQRALDLCKGKSLSEISALLQNLPKLRWDKENSAANLGLGRAAYWQAWDYGAKTDEDKKLKPGLRVSYDKVSVVIRDLQKNELMTVKVDFANLDKMPMGFLGYWDGQKFNSLATKEDWQKWHERTRSRNETVVLDKNKLNDMPLMRSA